MKIHRLLILLFPVLLASCLPEFKNPLTAAGEQKLDERLAGQWMKIGDMGTQGKKPNIHYNFSLSENKQYYVVSSWKTKGGVRKDNGGLMHIHTSKFKDRHYMNVKPHDPTGKKKENGYLILKYKLDGDKMGFSISNIGPFREAVLKGKLKGTVPKYKQADGNMVDSKYQVKVAASQRKLQDFFSKNDKKIFAGKFLFLDRKK